MSSAPRVCPEISGTAETIRSVADTARITATEPAGALVGSLSTHAGLATANTRADERVGSPRQTNSESRTVINEGPDPPHSSPVFIEGISVR